VASFAANRFGDEGWSTVFGLFLAGEAIEWLRNESASVHRRLLLALGALGAVVAVHGLAQMALGHAVIAAWLGDANTFGAELALLAPAMGVLWIPLLGLLPPALFGAGSTTPVLALVAAGLVTLWLHRHASPWWRWGAALGVAGSAVAFLVVVDPPGGSVTERLGVWLATLERVPEAWLLGHGPGSFSLLGLQAPGQGVWLQAHHEFVQWAYECGVVGVVAVTGYLGWLGVKLTTSISPENPLRQFRGPVTAMLVAGVVASCGHFVARLASTAAVLIVTLGMAEALIAREAQACP
jgi:hypothetical protein